MLLLSSATPGLALTWTSSLLSLRLLLVVALTHTGALEVHVFARFGDRCYHVGSVASLERCFWGYPTQFSWSVLRVFVGVSVVLCW